MSGIANTRRGCRIELTHPAPHSPEETRTSLLSLMAFSGAAAVFISYCTAWTVRTTSSTTFVRSPTLCSSTWSVVLINLRAPWYRVWWAL